MQRKIISENDYDSYQIYLPVKAFMNRRQKYISSQLEKMHPCFADNFCFDSKYSFSKKGVLANVVVMDKLRLGEYKAKYPGAKFSCENDDRRSVFQNKARRKLILFLCAVFVSGICFASVCVMNYQNKNNAASNIAGEETGIVAIENRNVKKFAYENFFSVISDGECKIESLSWKYDGFIEQIAFSVIDCFPEKFDFASSEKVSFSNIAYKNSNPGFSCDVVNKKNAQKSNDVIYQKGDYRSEVREVFLQNEIKIKSESYLPYKIRFQFSRNDAKKKLISEIEKKASKVGLCITEIDLRSAGENLFEMEIAFSNQFSYEMEKSVLENIEEQIENFWTPIAEKSNKSSAGGKKDSAAKNISVSGNNADDSNEKKIGTIIHADGVKTDFYKTTKGVIRSE